MSLIRWIKESLYKNGLYYQGSNTERFFSNPARATLGELTMVLILAMLYPNCPEKVASIVSFEYLKILIVIGFIALFSTYQLPLISNVPHRAPGLYGL